MLCSQSVMSSLGDLERTECYERGRSESAGATRKDVWTYIGQEAI